MTHPGLIPVGNGSYVHPYDPGEPGRGTPRVSVTEEEGRLLAALARDAIVIEVGTGLGVSTRWLAGGANAVVTVDPDPWVKQHVVPGLPSNVSHDVELPVDVSREPVYDLAFIDGNHAADAVARDIAAVLPLLEDGSLLVLHDYGHGDVRNGARACGLRFYHIETTHGLGLAVVRKQ